MREQSLLRRHIDLLAIAVVLVGYFAFSAVHSCVLTPAGAAARMRLERKMKPVHVDSRQFRWMRMARTFRIQLV
jgi:hypothetical protein